MERPEYVGYAACSLVMINVAAPILSWCTSSFAISCGCGWTAVVA